MFGGKANDQSSVVKRHSDNSSNSLVDKNSNHTEIPMQQFSVTPIPASSSNNTDDHEHGIEHDPLPPSVDYSGVKPTARYQFRALSRRALSYHRRQRITNIFCLIIWPVLLVLICFIIAVTSNPDKKKNFTLTFCTNKADPITSGVFSIRDAREEWSSSDNKIHSAWYPTAYFTSGYADELPCVRWFGESYPIKPPYENVTAADQAIPDTFYSPPPPGGWFKVEEFSRNASRLPEGMSEFWGIQKSINQTIFYAAANANVARSIGSFNKVTQKFQSKEWPPTDPSIIYQTPKNVSAADGLLAAIPVRYKRKEVYLGDKNDIPKRGPDGRFLPVEFTHEYHGQNFTPVSDGATLDVKIRDVIYKWADEDISPFEKLEPFGGLFFEEVDMEKQTIKVTMQYGVPPHSDWGFVGSSDLGSGLRQIITMTQMTNALVKIKHGGQYVISQGIRALPYEFDPNLLNGYSLNEVSLFLFPFGLSFLLPTFVSIIVQEKEDRHRAMMAMNGLKSSAYYLSHYLEFMVMQIILSLFFCFTCAAVGSQLVLRTNPIILIVVLLVWAHTQTCLSFPIASVFSRTRKASLIVYFFVAVTCILGSASEAIFRDNGVPTTWFIHPSWAFFKILFDGIRYASRINGLNPLQWSDFAPGKTLFTCLMILIGESVLFVLLALYIDAVAPSEYGVQKPWHFPISGLFKRAKTERDPESKLRSSTSANHGDHETDVLEGADADVYAERDRVKTVYDPEKTPLIIDGLYHRYRGKVEPALKGMSFGVETNTVLGLLGPNGAGKSTMIHLLTGLYKPTAGTAYVAGADIRSNMAMVHAKIGVCPQHDILWGDLTVADHLLFYSRLRGIPPELEQQAVTYAIASVSLTKFRDRQVKGLSGGEKRRVSIAISLLGDNAVIFLDEPSTGLDPAVRRIIWDIINRVKVNRTVVLTTHSMEEADILSDKIAIMTLGRLRCIGTSLHLKELYGSGFRLNVASKPGRLAEACASIEQGPMRGMKYRRLDKFTNATTFEFEVSQPGDLSRIFGALSNTSQHPDIEDWGISQTTLEDVFIKIVTEGDSALAMPTIVSQN
ncbi:hypothetical protein BGZ94_000677 [Podila epigama]|nr:hypothetical protein BGZ94_000677 [Podila epigama]